VVFDDPVGVAFDIRHICRDRKNVIRMKKLSLSLFLLLTMVATSSLAQKYSFGLSFGVAKFSIAPKKEILIGGPGYVFNSGFSAGFQFSRSCTDNLQLQSGITYSASSIVVSPHAHPGMDHTPSVHYNYGLLSVPVFMKLNFSKHFFLNGGVLGDIDISKTNVITSQSGIGAGIGIGAQANLSKRIAIELNPCFNFHGMILARRERYSERVVDAGLKLNVVFR
jgi:hypothetical protein